MLGVSACCNELALNRLSVKVTFLYKDFLARESPRTYLCRSIIMSYGAAIIAAIVSKKVKSKEMSYKSDFGKPACYEAPKVSVFNIVSEGSFCSSSLSVGSHSYTDDPEDFEYGGML